VTTKLIDQKAIWNTRPSLRRIYRSWFKLIRDNCNPGRTLEIGGGSGNFRDFWPDLLSTDIVPSQWISFCADANRLPIKSESVDNLVGVDILHHIYDPDKVFQEMVRVLTPGGKAIFVEPYIAPISGWIRKLFHHEEIDMDADIIYGPDKNPMDGNLAVPTRLFVKNRAYFSDHYPQLTIEKIAFFEFGAYLLSGGFSFPQLMPTSIVNWLHDVEKKMPRISRYIGLKMLVVLSKKQSTIN
jgi:SAM-dependent methyltransferase